MPDQQRTSSPPSKQAMPRTPSSKYRAPLTFNVAVMFLFYVLSVTICLSSFSTCICVVFNPLGTFRTIAKGIIYALVLTVLSTFLFAALFAVGLDKQGLLGSTKTEGGDEKNVVSEESKEWSVTREIAEATPIQAGDCESPAYPEIGDFRPSQEVDRDGSAQAATLAQPAECEQQNAVELECEGLRLDFEPLSVETQKTPPSEKDSEKQTVETATAADRTLPFCEQVLASSGEMSHEADLTKNALRVNDSRSTEINGSIEATRRVPTAGGSRRMEKWMDQSMLAPTHGMLKGEDADDEVPSQENVDIMGLRCDDSGPLLKTRSVIIDSDFQKALRVYMGKGVRYGEKQRRSGRSTPSSGSSEESEFQGLVRKTFMLEKSGGNNVGVKKRARSV